MTRPASGSTVKMCLKCKKILPLTDFFKNRGWVEQNGVDLYCRECARDMCYDKLTMRRYMWENNRLYSESMWEQAEKKAMRVLANNKDWLSKHTSAKRKEEIKNRTICNQFFFVMNLKCNYHYNENVDEEGNHRDFEPDSMDGMIVESEDGLTSIDDGPKKFSRIWNGMFTQREIDYLNEYYERLNNEFALEDINVQDYARKAAKASLEADKRYDNMRAGKCTSKEWKEAQDAFDSLSKSANFAACQKKNKNPNNNLSLCEIIADIEINHQADKPLVKFEKDDIDKILQDFAYICEAIK